MKKVFTLFAASLLIIVLLIGCGAPAAQTTPQASQPAATPAPAPTQTIAQEVAQELKNGDKKISYVGMCFPQFANPWFVRVKDDIQSVLEADGVKVESAACDNDHARQMEIVENYGEKGVDGLILFPIGASEIGGTLEKLQQEGVRVIVLANRVDKGYDGMLLTDYAAQGVECATAAAKWIDATFPDAAPGTVEVGLLSIIMSPESSAVSQGLRDIAKYTDKAKLVVEYEMAFKDPEIKAQENMEMMLSSFPNIKCMLSYSSGHALAADEVVMRTKGIDYAKFAIFSNTFDAVVNERIVLSRENKSVIRGDTISGNGNFGYVAEAMLGRIEFNADKIRFDPLSTITAENVDEYLKK